MWQLFCRGFWAIALAVSLSGCGGGGGSGDDSAGGDPGDGSSGGNNPTPAVEYNSFLPAGEDIELYYNNESTPATFTGDITVNSEAGRVLTFNNGGKLYLQSTPDGIYFLGYYAPELPVSGIGTFAVDFKLDKKLLLWNDDLQAGNRVQDSGSGTADISPTYGQQDFTFESDRVFFGEETVNTPFGPLPGKSVGLAVETTSNIDGTTVVTRLVYGFWFVEGIGIAYLDENGTALQLTDFVGPDADGDGVPDHIDEYPDDPGKTQDTDGDGIANEEDPDDDDDGVNDEDDAFPLDPSETTDSDGDGIGDNSDSDADGDGVPDDQDAFPLDPDESEDTDNDGIGNNSDTDDDNDSVADADDRFPLDPDESADNDNDGIGNNADPDDDNDSYADESDYYPFDSSRWAKLTLTGADKAVTYVRGSSETSFSFEVTVSGEGLSWQVEDLSSEGITAAPLSGSGDGSINLTVDMTQVDPLLSSQSLTVSVSDSDDAEPITLSFERLLPEFAFTELEQVLDASAGWDITELVNQVSLNTGSNEYAASIEVDFPLENAWQTGTEIQASGAGQDIALQFFPSEFSEGEQMGTITVSTVVDGEQVSGSYSFTVKASKHLLLAQDTGVALAAFPAESRLQEIVLIEDSYWQGGVTWNAVTSADWLSVTASGTTGGTLTLTADPTKVLQDQLYTAEVTISSPNPAVESEEKIRVAFWSGSADPQPVVSIDADYSHLVADPFRPRIYAASGNTVDMYNLYTGLLEDTFQLPVNSVGSLSISADGAKLFASDSGQNRLGSLAIATGETSSNTFQFIPNYARFARVNGRDLLLASAPSGSYGGNLLAVDPDTLSPVATSSPTDSAYPGELDVSQDGKVYCAINRGLSPYSLSCFDLKYASLGNIVISEFRSRVAHGTGSNGKDVAVSSDGAVAYAASGSPYVFKKINTETGAIIADLAAEAYPNAVAMGPEDRIHGASFTWYGPKDIWVYDRDGFLLIDGYLSGYAEEVKDKALAVSADGFISAALTTDPKLVLFRNY